MWLHDRRAALCCCAALIGGGLPTTRPALAATTNENVYDAVAAEYDKQYADSVTARLLDFEGLRKELLQRARGRVLELGVGTGLNLPLYPSGGLVRSIEGLDLSSGMLAQAAVRAKQLNGVNQINLRRGDASALPYPDECFDTVVDTFSLCVFDRAIDVLREASRVLVPGGTLLLLESDASALSGALSFTRSSTATAASCSYDQDVLALTRGAGFAVLESQQRAGGLFRSVVAEKRR